jgi:hypothetical protein
MFSHFFGKELRVTFMIFVTSAISIVLLSCNPVYFITFQFLAFVTSYGLFRSYRNNFEEIKDMVSKNENFKNHSEEITKESLDRAMSDVCFHFMFALAMGWFL